jgi:hypothetical protein
MCKVMSVKYFIRMSILLTCSLLSLCVLGRSLYAEEPSNPQPVNLCQADFPADSELSEHVTEFLRPFIKELSDESLSDVHHVARGYQERLLALIQQPVDPLHGRCWFDDQLSCATLASGVEDISDFLRSLQQSQSPAIVALQERSKELYARLNRRCREKRWNLG